MICEGCERGWEFDGLAHRSPDGRYAQVCSDRRAQPSPPRPGDNKPGHPWDRVWSNGYREGLEDAERLVDALAAKMEPHSEGDEVYALNEAVSAIRALLSKVGA